MSARWPPPSGFIFFSAPLSLSALLISLFLHAVTPPRRRRRRRRLSCFTSSPFVPALSWFISSLSLPLRYIESGLCYCSRGSTKTRAKRERERVSLYLCVRMRFIYIRSWISNARILFLLVYLYNIDSRSHCYIYIDDALTHSYNIYT